MFFNAKVMTENKDNISINFSFENLDLKSNYDFFGLEMFGCQPKATKIVMIKKFIDNKND